MKLKQDGGISHSNFLIQKRISILFSLVGILVIIINSIVGFYYYHFSIFEIFSNFSIWLTLILTIPFILFIHAKKEYQLIQISQLAILLFASTFAILDEYNNIYGSAFWIIFYLLLFKYGFLKTHTKIKSSILFLYLFIMIERSAYYKTDSFIGFSIIIFLIFFMTLLYIIYKAEIDRILFSEKNLKKDIGALMRDKDLLQNRIENDQLKLNKLEKEIEDFQAEFVPFDLDQCNLTPTELRIVEILARTRSTNKEISKVLGIKESTVKQHFYRIFNKMGVDERYQIIDLCKYNFE